jgi:hypothetical protein
MTSKRDWTWRNLDYANRMDAEEYRRALCHLGVSHLGAGKIFGLSARQAQRLASGDSKISAPMGKLIRLSLEKRLTAKKIQAL